jgi:hypothetical protein
VTKFAFLIPALALALAACGEEPAPAPVETPVATPEPTPSLPAPSQASFTALLAEACPEAEPVNTAVCKRAGMGSPDVVCEYGLGDDEFLRNTAVLTAGEGEWTLKDPATVCAAGA